MASHVYRLLISYRGTRYAGWQRQANALAVQQVVEEALAEILEAEVRVTGAGRTDAGVHARGQAAHLFLPGPFPAKGLVHGGNHHLPEDVRLLAAHAMPEGFHARASAAAKVYVYRWHEAAVVSALDEPFVAASPWRLDDRTMRRALALLPGRHDFAAFAAAGGSHKTSVRDLDAATLDVLPLPGGGRELRFTFVGPGFLRGMVRALVGTLLEVGWGRRSPDDVARLLLGGRREDAGPSAPATGLSLDHVAYGPRWRPLAGFDGRVADKEPSRRRSERKAPTTHGRKRPC